jgi:hypothetical protein
MATSPAAATAEKIRSCVVFISVHCAEARPGSASSAVRSARSWPGHILGARQSRPSITRGTQLTPSAPQMSSSSYSHAYRCRSLSGRPVREPLAGKPAVAGPTSGAPAAASTAPGDRGRAPSPGTCVCREVGVWMNSGSPEAIRSPAFPAPGQCVPLDHAGDVITCRDRCRGRHCERRR